jgi:hypothetical protein
MRWFAVRLNQHHEHTSACPGGFLAEKQDRQSGWVNNNANRYRNKRQGAGKGDLRVTNRFGLFLGTQAMLLAYAEAVPVPAGLRLLLRNSLKRKRIKKEGVLRIEPDARSGIRPTKACI